MTWLLTADSALLPEIVPLGAEAGDSTVDSRAPGRTVEGGFLEAGGRDAAGGERLLQVVLEALLGPALHSGALVELPVENLSR